MIRHNYPGKFIVMEGLDGSGKTSQLNLLVNFLQKNGRNMVLTKEPTNESEAGKRIAEVLREESVIDPLELQKLFAKDRKEHLENKVMPALKEGKYVVASRYVFSSFAYGASEGLAMDVLMAMNKDFLLPDLTIIIAVLPENCVKRIAIRGEPKKYFEKIEKLRVVNEFYKKFPGIFENVHTVNGERPITEVFNDVERMVKKII